MKKLWVPGVLCTLAAVTGARGSMITSLGTAGGEQVSASANFNMGAGTLTITVDNLTPYTADAAQLLTGITFSLSNGSTAITSAGLSATGKERTVSDDGTYWDSGVKNLSWELLSGTTMQVDFHPDARDALIGPADGESAWQAEEYDANGSIMGNSGHNPFGAESATFTLTNPAFAADTAVSGVTFLWGTSLSQASVVTPYLAVPEPASIGVLGLGTMMLLRRRRR
ncbi:MAG TPA: XDD4 family exosortase-dependent surface protein [Phycisphaerae bacterium]|nr:XDD4 family exosortase-dependent surface protein [Phycisphaerae bacterium]